MHESGTGVDFAFDESLLKKLPFQVTSTNLAGAYYIQPPPADFDASKASPDELIKNGICWPRPDSTRSPLARRVWERLYAGKQKIKWVSPKLKPLAGRTHILRKAPSREARRGRANASILTNTQSGIVLLSGTNPWNRVQADWVIPTVSQPTGSSLGVDSDSFIAISGSNNVLAVAVNQLVPGDAPASYFPWFMWAAPQQQGSPPYIVPTAILDVSASPGALVSCNVGYLPFPGITFGLVSILNVATNEAFSVTLAPPPGVDALGGSIQWGMDVPGPGEPEISLPAFTPLVFQFAAGHTAQGDLGDPNNGDILNIQNPSSGQVLTSVATLPELVAIDFIG